MAKVKRERVSCRLPRSLVADLDAYIEGHSWATRSTVVGEAVAMLMHKHGGGP